MVDKFVQPSVNALPGHLNERTRRLNHRPASAGAEFVLYWMHHAVRDHENPALETALWIADHLRLPVLVYQGLGGRHPYDNDRHHTFILQGARELENALTARGITYAFHLAKAPGDPSPLVGLISRAALTVTEDFPAPPINRWIRRLAAVAPTAFWSVDTACILPMQSVPKSAGRAFQFRQATWEAYAQRISQPYPTLSVTSRPFQCGLGFLPLDLASADIADCCAACQIDHTVGPVAHTQGGSRAGYARWEQFKQNGLKIYDQTRNDAALGFPSGVSRMSAYLHHGHVAPFRIVREAAMFGGRGAKKYLDEILIWRSWRTTSASTMINPVFLKHFRRGRRKPYPPIVTIRVRQRSPGRSWPGGGQGIRCGMPPRNRF